MIFTRGLHLNYTILKYKYEKSMVSPHGIMFDVFRKFKCDEYRYHLDYNYCLIFIDKFS